MFASKSSMAFGRRRAICQDLSSSLNLSHLRLNGELQLFQGPVPRLLLQRGSALNPTNPRDRTVDWEADVVNIFRNDPARTELTGHRETPDGDSLYFCAPIRVDDASCLTCHSTPETAPADMVKIYGSANGFGWKLNDVIGAQIVSIPAKLADASAERALKAILLWLGGILGFVLIAANIIGLLFFGRSSSRCHGTSTTNKKGKPI